MRQRIALGCAFFTLALGLAALLYVVVGSGPAPDWVLPGAVIAAALSLLALAFP